MAEAILNKLKDAFPDHEVDHYPDNPKTYQLAHPQGAILITLQERNFDEGQATDGTGQMNFPVFQVTYVSRSLLSKKNNPGAYDLLDQGRAALNGLELGIGNLNILWEGFLNIGPGGVWMYGQRWKHEDYFE
ncbi:Gp37 family protein [Gracilimonas tropica]|uniref:Gp37 family protein n=1 Tax=Gracilimonas tropica TaxID=454600 RepID=UPI00035DB3D2|nr:Gp37 family protein [Gracilimonas tropica]